MNSPSKLLVRRCPNCESERPVYELFCQNVIDSVACGCDLTNADIREEGASAPLPPAGPVAPAATLKCVNGHVLAEHDEMCVVCGADPAVAGPADGLGLTSSPDGSGGFGEPPQSSYSGGTPPTAIAGWELLRPLPRATPGVPYESFEAQGPGRRPVLLTLYDHGAEPDPAVHDILARTPLDHVAELIETGRHEGRAYEVTERIAGGTLADAGLAGSDDPARLRRLVDELSRALASFAEVGLRHREINPTTVCLRTDDPLDLVVTGFGSARLSDFDLESVAPLELTRYSAPETIVGAVSAASDWWSLGMIVLEQATRGRCFEGVNDQAFQLQVVTRGVPIPSSLAPDIRLLLQGLLARDPLRRWSAAEVRAWLAGGPLEAPETPPIEPEPAGPALNLAGRAFTRPDTFALAAAEAGNWDAARDLLQRGAVATWLDERKADPRIVSQVRRIGADDGLAEDFRLALALLALNPALPLTLRGEIVTPAWLLAHPPEGYAIVTGDVTRHLEQMGREPGLVRLRSRAEAVRERARVLEIALDEERVRIALLASRANLEAERDVIRQVWPDTDSAGLASILERARLSDEDLIILVGAERGQFLPLASLASATEELAAKAGVVYDATAVAELLVRPRREIFALVDARTANFARCDNPRIDEWADTFRVERRLALPRAAVLLAIPEDAWKEPPKQQYVATLLSHFEKRVAGAVSRGPLSRFTIGKWTPRVDLFELGTALCPAEAILNHVLSRAEMSVPLDPSGYVGDTSRETRLRRLVSHAEMFRRDTGLDGRMLGFPFIMVRGGRGTDGAREARPRLAPVLLWPVIVDLQPGSSAATVAFDREREEVRINPALEGLLGASMFQKWRAIREELLGRAALKSGEVIDAFGTLAPPRSRTLGRLPAQDAKVPAGTFDLLCAAALFNAEFTGQSVAEDLRQVARMPPAGTGLDAALRIRVVPPETGQLPLVREHERFAVAGTDPSQDAAVLRARVAPGLLVEGPPGTGKSQTIVNVVADAIGRGETVLVICQKQAALKVVQKRLDAEGLGERLFHVVDINRDREAIIRALRDQTEMVRATPSGRLSNLRRQREEKAARIEALEGEIDRHHEALHYCDDCTGLSYRDILGELIRLEAEGTFVDAPGLRPLLRPLGRSRVAAIEEVCSSLSRAWLDAAFEDSPLEVLRPFSVDASIARTFREDLLAFIKVERQRRERLDATAGAFDVEGPGPYMAWLAMHGTWLETMPDLTRRGLKAWFDLFRPDVDGRTPGVEIIRDLEQVRSALAALASTNADTALLEQVAGLPAALLDALGADVERATGPVSLLGRLNPAWWSARKRAKGYLSGVGHPVDDTQLARLGEALACEAQVRPQRERVGRVLAMLKLVPPTKPSLPAALQREAEGLVVALRRVAEAAAAVLACPRLDDAMDAARSGAPEPFAALRTSFARAFARHEARARSLDAIGSLETWFTMPWTQEMRRRIARNEETSEGLLGVVGAIGSLEAYQRFRSRAAGLDAEVLRAFRVLRTNAADLRAAEPSRLAAIVQRTLYREALLAWKGDLETTHPELLFEREEIARKVEALGTLDRELRAINRDLLKNDFDPARLGSAAAWQAITRLRGPQARRLREIIDEGADLGLMHLRPIWLMNPDAASRVLPLKAGLFDLVVFDEASQMPVEHAIPSLFRSRRILVAGDEKQMPPTSFFSSRVDGDDDEDDAEFDGFDEGATDAEREARTESWNRREIKDCPDLLQLARGVLPSEMLQIHYRSQYRELIRFSNAAFYRGELSVPARHPDSEIRRVRPIEVIRADGVYEDRVNPAEAAQVVDWIAKAWSASGEPPSIGVVTFNSKQADLIEDLLEKRAGADKAFLSAYQRERQRTQNNEDMGFFVKNVENVQGDERDVIVFSTTFGRDRHGAFRRNFGVLGQAGGERRLNVAVTRAREKVILLTSMPLGDISDWLSTSRALGRPRDYLQAYLDYAMRMSQGDLEAGQRLVARLAPRQRGGRQDAAAVVEDGFVRAVQDHIRGLGYVPVATSHEDAFGLDFAIEDQRTGLFGIGIECDAPRHALLRRARAREIWRPGVMRRAIPVVHRVSSHGWYHQPADERRRLGVALRGALG